MAQMAVVRCVAVVLTMAVVSLAASFGKGKPCPAGEFYDHGTELCEPCIGMCRNANLTKMVHKCQTLCPATFAQLNNRQKQPIESSHLSSRQSSPTTAFTGPSVALVIGGIVVVSFLIIVGAFVCKRVQDNGPNSSGGAGGSGGGGGGGGAGQPGSSDRGLNRSRQGYRPAGVQEEGGDQADEERQAQGKGLRSYCDPRHWFSAGPPGAEEVPAEETESGRQGPQDMALLGNSHGSVVQDLSQPKTVITTPIYKPSGSMRSTATRI